MSTLEAFTVHRFGRSAMVTGTVVIAAISSLPGGETRRPKACVAAFGWSTDRGGLGRLMTMVEATAGFRVPLVGVEGTIVCEGATAAFTAVRARPVIDWGRDVPSASLLMEFVQVTPHSEVDAEHAYATLQVTLASAEWAMVREVVERALREDEQVRA